MSPRGGELRLPSLEGVQHDDTFYPRHCYTATRGELDVPDCTDRATANHYTNNPP
jgi:hypothetical protein